MGACSGGPDLVYGLKKGFLEEMTFYLSAKRCVEVFLGPASLR